MAIRSGRASIGLAFAGTALVLAAGAAMADIAPVRIDYQAGAGCPGAAAFLNAVSTLTPNARPPPTAAPARRFTVRIARSGAQLVGRLRIEEIDGVGAEREVTGQTCDDVVAALALVTALAIDAGPIDAPVPGASAPALPSASAPPGIPASASASAPPPSPTASAAVPPPSASSSADVDLPPPVLPPKVPASPWTNHVELGASVSAFGAVSPRLAWGATTFVDWSGWGPTDLAHSVRLGVTIAQSPPLDADRGSATFRLIAARFAACPWALTVGPLEARPCGTLDFGALHYAVRSSLLQTIGKTDAWADFALGPRVQWRVGRSLVIEGDIALLFPLIRDTFLFGDAGTLVHEVPPMSGTASLGLGWLLP